MDNQIYHSEKCPACDGEGGEDCCGNKGWIEVRGPSTGPLATKIIIKETIKKVPVYIYRDRNPYNPHPFPSPWYSPPTWVGGLNPHTSDRTVPTVDLTRLPYSGDISPDLIGSTQW